MKVLRDDGLDGFTQFMNDGRERNNGYVSERGFKHLYVRKGPRYVNGIWHDRVIDLANFEVNHPGKGVFGRFVARLSKHWPAWGIYVESVLNKRLPRRLRELGFKRLSGTIPPCFWMPGS